MTDDNLPQESVDALIAILQDEIETKSSWKKKRDKCEPFFLRHMALRKKAAAAFDPVTDNERFKQEFHRQVSLLYKEIEGTIGISLYNHFLNVRFTTMLRDGYIDGQTMINNASFLNAQD